jgi:DivIVA domain-containing protein
VPSIEQKLRSADFPVVRKGYDPSAVDRFLDIIADDVAAILTSARAEGVRVRHLERELSALQQLEGDPSAVFLSAAKAKERLLEDAHSRAAQILSDAHTEASKPHNPSLVEVADPIAKALEEAQVIEEAARTIARRIITDARAEARAILATGDETAGDNTPTDTMQPPVGRNSNIDVETLQQYG